MYCWLQCWEIFRCQCCPSLPPPSYTLYHRSPWESLIQIAGQCVCDQSGQLLSSLRNKSVLNAQEHPPQQKWVTYCAPYLGFYSERIEVNTDARPNWTFYFSFHNETLFWQSRLKHCLLSCTKDSQKSKVCLPNCSVILKSNRKWCPDIQELFLWKESCHKWLLCYSCGRGVSDRP